MPDLEGGADGAVTEKVDALGDVINEVMDQAEQDTEAKDENRDERGRFKAKSEPEAEASEGEPEDPAKKAEDEGRQEPAPEEGTEPDKLEAPGHWPREDREAFEKLDRTTQELLVKRDKTWEGQTTRKSQELSEKAKFAEDVQGLFDEATRNQMALRGMDERAAIRQLVAAQQFATKDPVGYIKWFAQNSGVELGQLAPRAEGEDDDLDPSFKPFVSRIDGIEQTLQHWMTSQQQNQQSTIDRTVQSFRDAKSEDGTALHPHFDRLKVRMGALMEHDPTLKAMQDGPEKLQQAYDMVLYTDPELRQQTLEQEKQKALDAERKKQDAEKAKRAKSPKDTNPSGGRATKPTGLDDIIKEELDAHA